MKLHLNGFEMAFDDRGEGPTVVLIHGFPLCRQMWEGQAKALLDAGYRVVTPDLRGFGESEATEEGYAMDTLAGDVIALMDRLEIEQAVVGGMSMGGYVLLSLLLNYPERISAALFIVTRAVDDDAKGREKRTTLAETVRGGRPEAVSEAFAKVLFAKKTPVQNPSLVETVTGWMNRTDPRTLVGALIGMRDRRDFLPLLPRFDIPSLVIGAAEDITIPPENAAALAEGLPNSRLEIIPDAGHMVNLEQSDAFDRCLIGFLKSTAP